MNWDVDAAVGLFFSAGSFDGAMQAATRPPPPSLPPSNRMSAVDVFGRQIGNTPLL